jgi:mono/diheme cytochrome c family protein
VFVAWVRFRDESVKMSNVVGSMRRPLALAAVAVAMAWAAPRLGAQDPSSQPTLLTGAFSSAQASRGEETFKEVCVACHNIDEMAGARFRSSWADQTAGDIFDFLSNAMPQGDPGSLTPEEYRNIIAFFLSRSGYPTGERELPADKTELSKLRIVALPR